MSGGEQARILIARLMLRPADVLLLDEPTNDHDIPSLEVLEESLADFPGALVLVTHDRYMIRRLSTDILGLDGNGGANLFSSFEQWENARDDALRDEIKARKDASKAAKKDGGKSAKRLSYKEQQEWDAMEANILATEEKMALLHTQLETPEVTDDPEESCRPSAELADAAGAGVDGLYERWKELGREAGLME